MKKETIIKMNAASVMLVDAIVPIGVGVCCKAISDCYLPRSNNKLLNAAQTIGVIAITSYVTDVVTDHAVENVNSFYTDLDAKIDKINELRQIIRR